MSDVLDAHRQRVAKLDDVMLRLQAMHDEAHDVWQRIAHLAHSDDPHRHEELDSLHDEAYAVADRIARLREETFGAVSREAHLLLTSTVESARPHIVNPARPPLHNE